MVVEFLGRLAATSPNAKRTMWRVWYQFLSRRFRREEWSFMNYGYAHLEAGAGPIELKAEDEADRYYAQLYHRVATGADISGLDVLEVGSGRGGGCSYVSRYLRPKSVTGVDFSKSAIALCRKMHRHPGLTFVHGDAENLPIESASFDVVLNVESSHCYGRMEIFLSEVYRVLRPGGRFLFADFRPAAGLDKLTEQLRAAGFHIAQEEHITRNVLRAMELTSEAKAELVRTSVPAILKGSFKDFAGVPGTRVYNSFQSGEVIYMQYVMEKRLGPADCAD